MCICLLLSVVSCGKQGKNKANISGKIEHLAAENIYLVRDFPDTLIVDTIAVSADGAFDATIQADTLAFAMLYFNNGARQIPLFVDNGLDVSIKCDGKQPELAEVEGGSDNDLLTSFRKQNASLLKEWTAAAQQILLSDSVSDNEKVAANKIRSAVEVFADKHADKPATLVLLNRWFKDAESLTRLEGLLQRLKYPASTSAQAHDLRQHIARSKKAANGMQAPHFQFTEKGKVYNSDNCRGRYVLLSFTTPHCAGYAKNEQQLRDLRAANDSLQLQIFHISLGESKPKAASHKWTNIQLKEAWADKLISTYGVRKVPFNVLITPEGYIAGRQEFPSALRTLISPHGAVNGGGGFWDDEGAYVPQGVETRAPDASNLPKCEGI